MKMKRIRIVAAAGLAAGLVSGCAKKGFDPQSEIGLVSREDGSGTRSAFTELAGIQRKDAAGKKIDHTSVETMIASSTSVALTTVAGDLSALGYVSLGSINGSVKTLLVDGVAPTSEEIALGKYKLVHPFNVVTRGGLGQLSPVARDFVGFVLSDEGQRVVEKTGYLRVGSAAKAYSGDPAITGKVHCSGSSSVAPCLEKLKEAYLATHPGVSVEVQQSDSSTGVKDAKDGICDLGMASRELKESEKSAGLEASAIALDGLAVIVNPANPVVSLSCEQIRRAFEGEVRTWAELSK